MACGSFPVQKPPNLGNTGLPAFDEYVFRSLLRLWTGDDEGDEAGLLTWAASSAQAAS